VTALPKTKINLWFVATRTARCLAIAWLIVFVAAYFGQRKLMFMPFGGEVAPATVGLLDVAVENVALRDGYQIVSWRAQPATGRPTIVYFHGNAGNLAIRASRFKQILSEGWGLIAVSYPGFSGSTGSPSEAKIIDAALTAYDQARSAGMKPTDIVLWGESLGTGVAVQLAAQRAVVAVILDAPYSSVEDVAADRFWYLPVRSVITDRFNSVEHIRRVSAPVLILHGTLDQVIPVKFARLLAAAAPKHSKYVEYPHGTHVDLWAHGEFTEAKAWIGKHHRSTQKAANVN
jgi:uncharacterized protein